MTPLFQLTMVRSDRGIEWYLWLPFFRALRRGVSSTEESARAEATAVAERMQGIVR